MRNRVIRSFIIAQALAGIVLTVFWLAGQWPSLSMAMPLFGIAAMSVAFAFLPNAWIPSKEKSEATKETNISEHTLPATRNLERRSVAGMNRYSRDFLFIAAFLLITALLLRFVAPMPGA